MELPSVDKKSKPKPKKKASTPQTPLPRMTEPLTDPMKLPVEILSFRIPSSMLESAARTPPRCDVQSLTVAQGVQLMKFTTAMIEAKARLKNGVFVTSPQHVFKWILENGEVVE